MNTKPRVLIVGSMALDTIEAPGGKASNILGGAATFASLACSFFAQPVPICVVGEDFPQEHIDLLAGHGVDTSGIQRQEGKTFHWEARYLDDFDERETLDTQCNVFADFRPLLTQEQSEAHHLFLANIHPSLQLSVLDQMRGPKIVGCDTMNLWIDTEPATLRQVFSRCDILFLNDSEATLLCQARELRRAAEELSRLGPRCVVIKKGSHGAFVYYQRQVFLAPAYPLQKVIDPTGAGDAFAGAMMGYLAREGNIEPETVRKAVILGTILASFTVEGFGVDALRSLKTEEIIARYGELAEMTTFGRVTL